MSINVDISPSSLAFGNVVSGLTSSRVITFIAESGNSGVAIINASESGDGFSISPSSLSLEPGETGYITATFSPSSVASYSGSIAITGNGSFSGAILPLSGMGIAAHKVVAASPVSYNFMNQTNSAQTKTFSFVADNNNTDNVAISINTSGIAAPFTVLSGSTSFSLAPGASSQLIIKFLPTSNGSYSASLGISSSTSGASLNTATITITGTALGSFYNLPDVKTNSGLMKAYLYVDGSLPVLTPPTMQNWLKDPDKFLEELDQNPTEFDIANVTIKVLEDYSTYPEGFWNKVINGYVQKTINSSGIFATPQFAGSSPAYSNTIVRSAGSFLDESWKIGYQGLFGQSSGPNSGYQFTIASLSETTITTLEQLPVVTATTGTLISNPINLNVEIMFTQINGTNEEYLFRGSVYREETDQPEYRRTPSLIREFEISLVSMVSNLDSVPTSQLIVQNLVVTEQYIALESIIWYYDICSFANLIKGILSLAFNVDASLCDVVNNSNDLMFKSIHDTDTWHQWTDLFFMASTGTYSGAIPGVHVPSDGFLEAKAAAYAWANRFTTAKELLSYLCLHFGCVPKYNYGNSSGLIDANPANNKHRITFESRGQNGIVTMDGNIISSDFLSASPAKARSIRFSLYNQSAIYSMCRLNDFPYSSGIGVPSNANFDIDSTVDFIIDQTADGMFDRQPFVVVDIRRRRGGDRFWLPRLLCEMVELSNRRIRGTSQQWRHIFARYKPYYQR